MHALWIASGVIIWALHFTVLYGFTALACGRGFAGALPWVAGGATLAAVAALALVVHRGLPRRAGFNAWMTLAVALLSLVAVLYQLAPLLIVRTCA